MATDVRARPGVWETTRIRLIRQLQLSNHEGFDQPPGQSEILGLIAHQLDRIADSLEKLAKRGLGE